MPPLVEEGEGGDTKAKDAAKDTSKGGKFVDPDADMVKNENISKSDFATIYHRKRLHSPDVRDCGWVMI